MFLREILVVCYLLQIPMFCMACYNTMSGTQADIMCKQRGFTLLDHEFLGEKMLENNVETSWLCINPKSWRKNKWLDDTHFGATQSSANFESPSQSCGILQTVYSKIDEAYCTEQGIGYICELEDGVTCQYLSPFECVRVDNRHFRLYERTSSWFNSRQLCKTKGGHLALLKSKRIQRNLSAAILKHHPNTTKYFIGLRGFDYFQDERLIETHHWYIGEPSLSDGCVIVQNYPEGFFWKTVNCQEKHPFLCVPDVKRLDTCQPFFTKVTVMLLNQLWIWILPIVLCFNVLLYIKWTQKPPENVFTGRGRDVVI